MRPTLFFCGLLALTVPAAGQTPAGYPHGPTRRPLDCEECHSPDAWRPLREDPSFDHRRATGFPLDGRHAVLGCRSCHANLRFDTPRASLEQCASCHQDPHRGRLSTDCTRCHDPRGFQLARTAAAHERSTFPLTGAHRAIACEACHRDERAGAFTPVDARCIACHRTDLARALQPDHRAPLFQAACETCHRTTRWQGAAFDHLGVSEFPLQGAHRAIECASCHIPPDFRLRFTPASAQDCVACHRADYDREHGGTGFPTQCINCHVVERWGGARFDHSFPIFNGRHAGEWDTCTDCHNAPGNFSVFTCLTCHTRTETDQEHVGKVQNYVYESARCLACHPRGEE